MRELYALRQVEREFINSDELQVHLRNDFEEDRFDIYLEQELFVALGILGRDERLFDLLLKMFGEAVLGFFDTEKEKLYVVNDDPEFGPDEELTFVHEFVHGLQQQHFDIHAIGEALEDNSDTSRAFSALAEGDAVIAQTIYRFQHLDREEQAAADEAARSADLQVFLSAPYTIQRLITFPYVEGPQFVLSLFFTAGGWDNVSQAFEDLPQSTEQILHPSKYISGEEAVVVDLPDLTPALLKGWFKLHQDTLGEFLLRVYLEPEVFPVNASRAAAGWGGDRYVLYKGPGDATLLASLIVWDSERDAQEFFDAVLGFMESRESAAWEKAGLDDRAQLMSLPGQSILIEVLGDRTLMIFGPDPGTVEIARAVIKQG